MTDKKKKPIDIKEATTEQLKALAYDVLVQLQQLQAQLNVINEEIAKRSEDG